MKVCRIIILMVLPLLADAQDIRTIDSLVNRLKNPENELEVININYQLFNELNSTDSLRSIQYALTVIDLAKETGNDSIANSMMYDLGWSLLTWGNIEAAKAQFELLIHYASSLQYARGEASGYKGLGDALRLEADYTSSLENYLLSIKKWEETGDLRGLGYCFNNIGVVYRNLSNTPKALEYYLKAVNLLEEIQDARGIGYISSNIGNIYYEKEDYDQALLFHQKALKYNEELKDHRGVAFSLNNIGLVFLEKKEIQKAMQYFKQSLMSSLTVNHKEGIILAYINIGDTYVDMQEYDSAYTYLQDALIMSRNMEDQQSESYALIGLGDIKLQQYAYSEAVTILKEAIKLSQAIGYQSNVIVGAEKLALAEWALGNYQKALEAYMLFKEVSDSIYNENQTEKLVRVQTEYEFQKERDSVSFAQEKDRLMYESEISRRKSNQALLVIGLLLVCIVIVLVLLYSRKLQRLNVAITKQRDELDRLNKTKSRFFSIIAHDLRGPMSILIGYGDLMQRHIADKYGQQEDPELEDLSSYLKESSQSVLGLLDSLLTWAIKEEGGFKLNPERLIAKDCVIENFQILKHQALSKDITLEEAIDEQLTLTADKNSLMTILRNLISNALKFTPEGGRIQVLSFREGSQVTLQVKDTGVGIPDAIVGKLFEVTEEKVSKGTKGESGTGLGLNLVHDFVKLNHGTISVQSEVGVGTTFTVTLPA